MIHEKTGLLLDPYFSATKLAWILDHVSGAARPLRRAGWPVGLLIRGSSIG